MFQYQMYAISDIFYEFITDIYTLTLADFNFNIFLY